MRLKPFAIAMLFPLTAGQAACAQHAAQPGDASAASPDTAEPSKAAVPRPEQPGDFYQANPRTDGTIAPPAKQNDPLPGALDAPVEPLSTGRPAEAKN